MLKKILVLVLELALMALVIYGAITLLNSISFADGHETAPWCVTELSYMKDFVRYE